MLYGRTRLQIINAVLERMRESTVATSSSTTYAALVSQILNQVKDQIEAAWQWRALRDTYDVTVTPATQSYSLTSAGAFAQILDVWNTTTGCEVARGTTRGFNKKFFGGTSGVQTGDVSEYNPVGLDSNFDVQIDTWPVVTRSNVLKVNVYLPTQEPADATVILIPNQVLIEGIVAYLIAERGDDGGVAAQAQMALYQSMLSDAIAAETGQDESEIDWYVA